MAPCRALAARRAHALCRRNPSRSDSDHNPRNRVFENRSDRRSREQNWRGFVTRLYKINRDRGASRPEDAGRNFEYARQVGWIANRTYAFRAVSAKYAETDYSTK